MSNLALRLGAGHFRFAIPIADVLRVLPRLELSELPLAPRGIVGLLPFEGMLIPVLDLCLLLLGRPVQPVMSTRLVLVRAPDEPGKRWRRFGLLAEEVTDLVQVTELGEGLDNPELPWAGEHLLDGEALPQLIRPAALLPEPLKALFRVESTEGAAG